MTRAERLNGLLTRFLPVSEHKKIETGEWGDDGAPYFFSTTREGKRRMTVENRETGDRIGVVADTPEGLLDAFEQRLR